MNALNCTPGHPSRISKYDTECIYNIKQKNPYQATCLVHCSVHYSVFKRIGTFVTCDKSRLKYHGHEVIPILCHVAALTHADYRLYIGLLNLQLLGGT